MKTKRLFKSILGAFVLITVFSLSLTTMTNVSAAETLAQTIVPNSLEPMTTIGESVLENGNFTNILAVNRRYGLSWRLCNLTDEYGADSERAKNPATVSAGEVTDKPEAMGNISTAIKVTSHGSNFALGDALTYNSLESVDYRYFGDKHVFYFSMWAKVEEETWFDITISYADTAYADGSSYKHGKGQYFYDLGRKFKVTPEDGWKEIGKDENGNYVPFRTIALGTDPGELTSTSYFTQTNAREDLGNAYIDLPLGLNWSVIRIYAYGPNSLVAQTNGLMGNGDQSGITAETSYMITGVKFWPYGSSTEEVVEVENVTLNATTKTIEKGKSFVLTPTFYPDNAEIETTKFESSNTNVVTVNNFGQVTAVGIGNATITYTVNNSKSAQCVVTVVPKVNLPETSKTIEVGKSFNIVPTVEEGELGVVQYVSNDTSVATVDSTGKVNAIKEGTTTISITAQNQTLQYTVIVKVAENKINPFVIVGGGAAGILVIAVAAYFIVKKSKK